MSKFEQLVGGVETQQVPAFQVSEEKKAVVERVIKAIKELPPKNRYENALRWARDNFEPHDFDELEKNINQGLYTHLERKDNAAYGDLLLLIFYLSATYQFPKVSGLMARATRYQQKTTNLDTFHPWHLIETAGHLARINEQAAVIKSQLLVELWNIFKGYPMSSQQYEVLASLALHSEKGFVSPNFPQKTQSQNRLFDIHAFQRILDNTTPENLTLLTERRRLKLPFYEPDFDLSHKLHTARITVADIGKNAGQSIPKEKKEQLVAAFLPEIDLTTIPELGL